MDSKQLYQYYLAEANRRGYKMKWYEALVSFFLIFWVVVGVLQLISDYFDLDKYNYLSSIHTFDSFLYSIFIIQVLFSIAILVILILLRIEMRKFSSKVITYLWIYLFLRLVIFITIIAATASYIGSLSLVLEVYFLEPATWGGMTAVSIVIGLHAIYFYKRRHLFGHMTPPVDVSQLYYQSPQAQNTQPLYYPQQQSPPSQSPPPTATANEAVNDLSKMEVPPEATAEINTGDTAQEQEKQKEIDQALAFLLEDEESLPDYLKNTEKE